MLLCQGLTSEHQARRGAQDLPGVVAQDLPGVVAQDLPRGRDHRAMDGSGCRDDAPVADQAPARRPVERPPVDIA